MDETSRRRAVQSAYNARNGLVPTPISRAAEGSPDMLDLLDEVRRDRAEIAAHLAPRRR
jgi:excinuclease UvrABC helicase subunit UvrB